MAWCVSWRHVFLFSFTLLFVMDVLFDILAVIEWYRNDHFEWFIIGIVVLSISFIMQWLYCLNNMNSYLNYLQFYKYSGWKNYNHYLNFDDTHYVDSDHNNCNNNGNISKCKEKAFMSILFIFKSIVLHLLLQMGIIEAFITNCVVLSRYNKKSKNKKNIFDFDPQNNYNEISKYPNPVLQFNTNYMSANFADVCILHCYFESVIMSLLHCTFFLSHFVFNAFELIYLMAFITSILSVLVFVFNFEKARIYPSYFEYDTLSRIKYILPDLYLYPSTYSIYQITNIPNNKKKTQRLAPPTCHYPTQLQSNCNTDDVLPSCSDIFIDQNNHHDINNNGNCNKFTFLCHGTFYLYLFCDFCCRTSPFILSFVQLSVIDPYIDIKSQWLFWINVSFLILFTLDVTLHFVWLHHKYSDYFKPSAPFWRYTIKKYLKCHYIHPLSSILDTEPLFAWFLRNCLFWFAVLIICNISIVGFIFNRPTLSHKRWHETSKKVEKSLIVESLIRYFFGFIIILLIIIFDSFYNQQMFYCVAIWTFVYCIFALFCCFIILKISRSSLLRLDAVWISRVRKRGWILSRSEEGLIWHRNYNKAQSFQIKRRQKRKVYPPQHQRPDAHNGSDPDAHDIAMVPVHVNQQQDSEQQIKCLPATKTQKRNDCSNETITMDINIINNINISNIDNNSVTNTTVNSSNINVKISNCTIIRPQPSILRTTTNHTLRPSSSEPPPSTSTPTRYVKQISSSPPHYPPPQLSLYNMHQQHPHSHPNIFDTTAACAQLAPSASSSSSSSSAASSSSSSASSRRIMLMDEEDDDEDKQQLPQIEGEEPLQMKSQPDIEIFRKQDIFTPNNSVMDYHMNFDPFSETSPVSGLHVKNGWNRDNNTQPTNASPNKQIVSVTWHTTHHDVSADVRYKHPRLSWSENDIKYPLKWLMNQHQSNKSDKIRKKDNKFKSIHHSKSKQKVAFKQHSKITLLPMDENMDNEYIEKRPSLSKKHSISSLSRSRSKETNFKIPKKKKMRFGVTTNDDMISIDETGAFLKHDSSDTSDTSSSSSDTAEYHRIHLSTSPRSKPSVPSMHTALSFDEINKELNEDNTLRINIQNTNTKLFDTLRKLSSHAQQIHKNTKGAYHNIPNQNNIMCDNSSDDSVCDVNHLQHNHVADVVDNELPTVTHSLINDIACNIDND